MLLAGRQYNTAQDSREEHSRTCIMHMESLIKTLLIILN